MYQFFWTDMVSSIPRKTVWLSLALFFALFTSSALAKSTCVEVNGEGFIVNGDVPSAKTEAVNRAKWAAVEKVAGVDLKSKTIVQNSALLDDVITSQARGVLTGYTVISEKKQVDSVTVRINACVEPVGARSALSALALNATVSVFIPSRKPVTKGVGEYQEENILSQSIMGKLAEQGFTVRDIAETHSLKLKEMETALKGGDSAALRSLVYRHLSNTILIGRVESSLSMKKGEDAGYGINMPFNTVTSRLTYRLMTRDASGKMTVLAAGTEEGRGLAPAAEDAYSEALKTLAEKFIPLLSEKINARLKEISSKVTVRIEGVTTPSEMFALRDQLQKIIWVSEVEEAGIGEFRITFPENPLYLANGLSQKGFKIVQYSREAIRVKR